MTPRLVLDLTPRMGASLWADRRAAAMGRPQFVEGTFGPFPGYECGFFGDWDDGVAW